MEYRQNQWETNGTSSDDNVEKEKSRGNIGLPFGLCEKYGIRLPPKCHSKRRVGRVREERRVSTLD